MFSEFDDFYKHNRIERTSATAYQSAIYTKPLTPEHVLGHRPRRPIQRGQIPWPMNRFHKMENFHSKWVNGIHHCVNDRYQNNLFNMYSSNISTPDLEPRQADINGTKPRYEDDIFSQTAAGIITGIQFGLLTGIHKTLNFAKGSGVYQSKAMPQNRWLPVHKATVGFKVRIIQTYVLQLASLLGTFQLTDGLSSQIRGKDDFFNYLFAGFCMGWVGVGFYGKAPYMLSGGLLFGAHMVVYRFFIAPIGTPKPALDFDSPLWGLFIPSALFLRRHPTTTGQWWTLFDRDARIWMA